MNLSGMSPIGLDELVERAPLLSRVDRKYVVPLAVVPTILCGLSTMDRVLDIDGRREFAYRSWYFDTPRLDCYLATAHRRRRRYKVRIRGYDTGARFLEVKSRGPRGTTVKQRMPYAGPLDGAGTALDGAGTAFVTAALAAVGIRPAAGRLQPTLTTHYRRSTLFLPRTGARVTIDTGLAWSLPSGDGLPLLTGGGLSLPDRAVIETKSPRAMSQVDRLLWRLGHRPCAVSKYGTGLAALRTDLPAHHWRPVLRRHFTW